MYFHIWKKTEPPSCGFFYRIFSKRIKDKIVENRSFHPSFSYTKSLSDSLLMSNLVLYHSITKKVYKVQLVWVFPLLLVPPLSFQRWPWSSWKPWSSSTAASPWSAFKFSFCCCHRRFFVKWKLGFNICSTPFILYPKYNVTKFAEVNFVLLYLYLMTWCFWLILNGT